MAPIDLDVLNAAISDRYALERLLGEGGMATVYLARDVKHERQVAVKVMRPELTAVIGGDRFLHEIKVTSKLQHPHILPLFDSGEAGSFLFYVMPYVEGESLRDRLERDKQLSIDESLAIARATAAALDYAHRHGVIHRDIKPENILLEDGEAVISDFGISLALDVAGGERLTETGLSLGTPQYMSPEQASGDRALTPATDIYALGCVVYEMLAGDPPHTASTTAAVIAKILTEQPTRLSVVRDSTPPHVEAAVHRALAKVPADRFASAADFGRALGDPEAIATTAATSVRPAPARATSRARNVRLATVAVMAGALLGGYMAFAGDDRGEWARNEALPDIARLIEQGEGEDAYRLAREARQVLPGNPVLDSLWNVITVPVSLNTMPPGAVVRRKANAAPDSLWETLGTTPLEAVPIPRGYSRIRIELAGHYPLEFGQLHTGIGGTAPLRPTSEPTDAMRIPATNFTLDYEAPGLWHTETVALGEFLIDRYEVTNGQYKAFVDAGGYGDRTWWRHPFIRDGRPIPWETAMAEFVDATGRPGPATWEVGDYPDGQDDYPVTGVSWYEAAAFAAFTDRALPTVYHWYLAASTNRGAWIYPLSNLESTAPARVGAHRGVTAFGLFDTAGNAREWVFNARNDERYILGGGWNDPVYAAPVPNATAPMDRSPTNGFRLITPLGDSATLALARRAIANPTRDFARETPVADDIFEIYRRMYAYDRTPLNAVVEVADTTAEWIRERVSLDAAYGNERVLADVYRPRHRPGPFQTVVYFPGSNAMFQRTAPVGGRRASFVVKSGRAYVFPIYKGQYERDDGYTYPLQDESSAWRDHVIQWGKDLGRVVDYLETRPDIDRDRLAYMGLSLGGRMGGIMLAIEPRFRVGVLNIPGFSSLPTQPEVDPFNFTSRITQPVLMLSGRYDAIYPLETAARPMFQALTSAAEKRHVISEAGHFVVWNEAIAETLAWLDRHLGPVE